MRAIDAHSPSKLFAKVGRYASEGMAVGFVDDIPSTYRQIQSSILAEQSRLSAHVQATSTSLAATPAAGNTYNDSHREGDTIMINARKETAVEVAQRLRMERRLLADD